MRKLIMLVVVLALVRVALPKFRNNISTSMAGGAMRGGLRNAMALWDSLKQAGQPLDSAAFAAAGFDAVTPGVYSQRGVTDRGVQIRVFAATATGFAAEAHSDLLAEDARCAIWAGDATPPIAGVEEGAARCERFFEPLLGRERLRRGLGGII